MMKNIIYILLILTFFSSCSEHNKKKDKELTIETKDKELTTETKELILKTVQLSIHNPENNILIDWSNYHKSLDASFSLDDFFLERSDTLNFIQGNVFGVFDKEFDKIYNDFIVYSPDKKRYIDFDSYQWTLDEDNKVMFSADQEINLIDVNKKSVKRIGFNGPLQWVDNVFWENDTTVVLLENSSEKELRISKIDIVNKYQKTYKYRGTLNVNSKYSELRLSNKGLKTE
jgi:hypothetical protein